MSKVASSDDKGRARNKTSVQGIPVPRDSQEPPPPPKAQLQGMAHRKVLFLPFPNQPAVFHSSLCLEKTGTPSSLGLRKTQQRKEGMGQDLQPASHLPLPLLLFYRETATVSSAWKLDLPGP